MPIPIKDKHRGLTQSRLREVLSYDPETGVFTWRMARGRSPAGAIAGSVRKGSGRREINIDGRHYRSHRLAWFYMTGEWPAELVDHRNRQPEDDRWNNLREATNTQNTHNSVRKAGASGMVGARAMPNGRFRSEIRVAGGRKCLGTFATVEEAATAYAAAKAAYHPFSNGEI